MTPIASPIEHGPDLAEYVSVLRRRKLQVGMVPLLAMVVAVVLALRRTPTFQSTAEVLVKPLQGLSAGAAPQAPNLDTERQLVLSQAVAETVRSSLRLGASTQTLVRSLRVEVIGDTEVLAISYLDPDPRRAARMANGFADAYVDFRSQEALDQFQTAAGAVQKRIDGLQGTLASLTTRIRASNDPDAQATLQSQRDTMIAQLGVLQQRLLDLQSNASVAQGAAQVVQRAAPALGPSGPTLAQDLALALLAGLVVGVGLAFLRERLDDRIRSHLELERRLGAPVLATVPRIAGWRRQDDARLVMSSDPRSPVSETYRTLATNLQYLASRQRLTVVLVTSAIEGEGKSTTSSNLAVGLARTGRRAILINADMRRPRIHRFFGIDNDIGLSTLLAHGLAVPQVARDVAVENLRVVPAGPTPPNPAELLGSHRMPELIAGLREMTDFVIIDTPPVLAVADASVLAPLADGVIIVSDATRSSRAALVQAKAQLENVGASVVGAVYNNFDPNQALVYPYAYSHADRGRLLRRRGRLRVGGRARSLDEPAGRFAPAPVVPRKSGWAASSLFGGPAPQGTPSAPPTEEAEPAGRGG